MIRKWLKFWVLVLLSVDISAKGEIFDKNYRFEGINKRSYQDADSTEHTEHSGFTTEQEEGILELINSIRGRDEYNQVSNKMRMEWNEDLASIAKKWSDQCKMEFGPPSCEKKFSQNRGIISNYLLDQFRQVNDWADGSNYTYKTNTCNGICDSYKVLMWAGSYAVGCSKSECKNFKTGYFMICNFYPPIPDLGMKPYKVGKACAACPSDSTCEEGFCGQYNL
ncbi:uncharacterized protein [Centruroides vittatus]|uniref:uncharacterized protein n=1 Tax=Centruroides vittatus TaxID=120091 RepID=UPI003510507E